MPETAVPKPAFPPGELELESRGAHLGFVAHEVRNPLSTALWSAELLSRMAPEDRAGARGDKLTAMCLRSLGRVRQLIEDHFLCERLDAEGIPLHGEPIALRSLIEELSRRKGMEVTLAALEVPDPLRAFADAAMLDRALETLFSLAGREGNAVRVTGREEGGRVLLRFEGYPAADGLLRDPSKGTPGDSKGRSLAGPLLRRIAQALGGTLSLEQGSYLLTLPARGEASP